MKKTLSTIMIVLTAIISLTLTTPHIEATTQNYSYNIIQNATFHDGATTADVWQTTSLIEIQNNTIILDFNLFTSIKFYISPNLTGSNTYEALNQNTINVVGNYPISNQQDLDNLLNNHNFTHFTVHAFKGTQSGRTTITQQQFQTLTVSYSTPTPSIPEFNPLDIIMQGGSFGLITFKHTENITQTPINNINQFAHVMEVTYPNNWFVTDIQWIDILDEQNIQNSIPINHQIIPIKTITSGTNKITYFYLTGNSWTWPTTIDDEFYGLYLRVDGLNGDFETFTELAFAFAFDGTARDMNSSSGMERSIRNAVFVAPTGTTWDGGSTQIVVTNGGTDYNALEFPSPPAREGFVFSHWEVERSFGSVFDPTYETVPFTIHERSDGKYIIHTFDFDPQLETESSLVFKPVYTELIFYEVTFVDWDGTFISSGLVQQGQSAPLPTQPTRVGHTFTSWLPPIADIQGNITTVAQYDPILYTVTWRNVDFSTIGITQVAHGEIAVPIQYNAGAGFRVQGWTGNFGLSTPVTENRFYVVSIVEVENATGLTDLFSAVLGASVGSILTLGTIDLFGIQLSSLIYLFVFGSLALTFLKIIRGN
jgi:hypothetical protein